MYILPHLCFAKDFWNSKIMVNFVKFFEFLKFYNSTYLIVWMFFSCD
jgi:hypothetical protein